LSLTVFSIIRNGIQNGYPFVEAYGSWLAYCDRLVVLEGCSTDGTGAVLRELCRLNPRLEVIERPWPAPRQAGSAIAQFTDQARALAAPGADWLMYIQADEIYTRLQRQMVRQWSRAGDALEFPGCINFWNSLDRVLGDEIPWRYVRLFPSGAPARSLRDGYSFDLGGTPLERAADPILHYGWCFPVNILQKHLSHAALYRDDPQYRLRGWLAGLMLRQGRYDQRLLDALAPQYHPRPFQGEHPECMRHLLGLNVYDPYRGLERLEAGASW
jgi:hypothetical protein